MAFTVQTDKIGEYLQKEYGSKPPNTHIECFYIRLGQEICKDPKIQQKAIDILKDIPDLTVWGKTEPGWDGVFFFEAPVSTTKNEREHEAEIDDTIRWPMMEKLREQGPGIHIMFSRACLYKDVKKCAREITTDQIGDIMENVGSTHIEHIEYFYLFVQEESGKNRNVHSQALEELKTLPGDWKSVEPQATWPRTFFGFFPNGTQEINEREREKTLNGEVRMPLIERLEAHFTPRDGSKIKIQVILTRACKYTPEKMDIS